MNVACAGPGAGAWQFHQVKHLCGFNDFGVLILLGNRITVVWYGADWTRNTCWRNGDKISSQRSGVRGSTRQTRTLIKELY